MERLQKERESHRRPGADVQAQHANAALSNDAFKFKPKPSIDDSYNPMALVKSRVALSESESNEKKAASGSASRRRYYSSSDDSEGEDNGGQLQMRTGVSGNSGEKFLSKLESFDSDFWNDGKAKDGRNSSDFGHKKAANTQVIISSTLLYPL